MNPLLREALGAIVRWVLAIGAGYVVKAGIWSEGDALAYTSAAALALVALGWSVWQKYKSRQTLVTALASSTPMTETLAKRRVALGLAPSVTGSADVIPG